MIYWRWQEAVMLYGCRLPLLIIDSVLMSALLGRSRDGSDTNGLPPSHCEVPPPSPAAGIGGAVQTELQPRLSPMVPASTEPATNGSLVRTGCYQSHLWRERSPPGDAQCQGRHWVGQRPMWTTHNGQVNGWPLEPYLKRYDRHFHFPFGPVSFAKTN